MGDSALRIFLQIDTLVTENAALKAKLDRIRTLCTDFTPDPGIVDDILAVLDEGES